MIRFTKSARAKIIAASDLLNLESFGTILAVQPFNRFIDSPELRAWCVERAGRRVRSLARKQAKETREYPLATGETLTKPWAWTKDHEALLHRKRPRRFGKAVPRLDPVAQDMWRKLAKKHKLGVYDLMRSIHLGRVERTKVQGVTFKRGGFATFEGIAGQFRFLRQRIGEEWRDWAPQEKALLHDLIFPIVEFDRQLRGSEANDVA